MKSSSRASVFLLEAFHSVLLYRFSLWSLSRLPSAFEEKFQTLRNSVVYFRTFSGIEVDSHCCVTLPSVHPGSHTYSTTQKRQVWELLQIDLSTTKGGFGRKTNYKVSILIMVLFFQELMCVPVASTTPKHAIPPFHRQGSEAGPSIGNATNSTK